MAALATGKNANGMRAGRSSSGTSYSYVYNGSQLTQMTVGNYTLQFRYSATGAPMAVICNGTYYYYITNIQGDVIGIVDTLGNTVVTYAYDAWGNILGGVDNTTVDLADMNPLRYRGYVYDYETGLYYLQSRYYNPEIGRFISADKYVSTGQGIVGYNMFVYCNNNPVNYQDNTGDSAVLITLGIMLIGGFIGAGISAVSSAVTQFAITGEINWKSVGVAAGIGFISGAVAASPLGIVGQRIVGGILGGASYIADCYVNDQPVVFGDAVTSVLFGVISGQIGGPGANENLVLTKAVISAKGTIAREMRRANQKYAQKIIKSTIDTLHNMLASTAWTASMRFAIGCGVSNGVIGKLNEWNVVPDVVVWEAW